jgi:hypothetical protein
MVEYNQDAQEKMCDQGFVSDCIDSDECRLGYIELDPALSE